MSACGGEGSVCASRGGTYLGQQWETCPVSAAMRDRRLQAALTLDGARRVSPLADWPDGYAAWVPGLLAEIESVRSARSDHDTGGAGA